MILKHFKDEPLPAYAQELHKKAIPPQMLIFDKIHQSYVRPPLFLCGPGNLRLGEKIGRRLFDLICERNDVNDSNARQMLVDDMFDTPVKRFPDGHANVQIGPSCDKRDVFIFQIPYPNPDKRIIETCLMIDAARRAGAKNITVILPYFAYGRGDKKDGPRQPIAASAIGRMLIDRGATRIITEDIHADQTEGSVDEPWDNLYASAMVIPELEKIINPENTIIMSADMGGTKRANAYRKRLKARGIATVIKNRELNEACSSPEALAFIGEVQGREVVIVDDESVSFSSLSNAAHEAVKHRAIKVTIVLSHLKYARENKEHKKMLERIMGLPKECETILLTDSILLPKAVTELPIIKTIDSSYLWAEVVWRTKFGVSLGPDLIN